MKKPHIIVLLVLIVILALVFVFSNKEPVDAPVTPQTTDSNTSTPVETGDRTVSGTVVTVNTAQMAVDGPALINVKLADNTEAVVAVPSMGINLCAAKANIADVSTLKAGNKVEVRGSVGVDGRIIPCDSSTHYLRVTP